MTVATVANIHAKCLILLGGGPGRTRISNQAVMSAVTSLEQSAEIDIYKYVR